MDAPPILRDRLSDTTGGLVYHLRALRHRHGLWAPFHAAVASWLDDWQPDRRHLVLVGPSAGYSLPAGWLARFERVTALEPDPVARWLLQRRPDAGHVHFGTLDCLGTPDGLAHLAHAFPDAAILFCNILGQLEAPGGKTWSQHLAKHLANHPWASHHDAISTTTAPIRNVATSALKEPAMARVLEHFWAGGELPLVDHDTFRLGGDVAHRYALWQITGERWHLVEWITHAAPEAKNATSV